MELKIVKEEDKEINKLYYQIYKKLLNYGFYYEKKEQIKIPDYFKNSIVNIKKFG